MREALESIELEALLLARYLAPIRQLPDGEHSLERSHYTLLTRLDLQGPMSISQLSDAFGLDASTLNRQTAAMMRAGLVDRIPDPDGGVARKFEITEVGKRRLHTERESNIDGIGGILADWPDEDVATFAELLNRANTTIEERSGRTWPRPPSDR